MSLFMELAVTMATIYLQACFSKFGIFMFFKEENKFLAISFTFFDHVCIILLVLFTFESFLAVL